MLTNTAIRNAKHKDKQYKLTDGQELYLLVNKTNKYWHYDYRFHGKRKTLALCVYPGCRLNRLEKLTSVLEGNCHKQ